MKIGLIGIGVMGEPMARHVRKAGHQVAVFNRSPQRCEPLRSLGIEVLGSARELVEFAEVTVLMVPSHVEVDEVLERSADGAIGAPVQGKTIVLMATVAPAYSLDLGARLMAAGARYVEAPVSGSKQPAENAQLVILAAAAEPDDIDAVQPLFDAIGKKTVRCGVVPMAMRMKLANQLLLIAWFEAISEATHFAQGIGLDAREFLEMAQAGPLANDVLRSKVSKLTSDDFTQQAPVRHVAKDIGLVCDEAAQRGLWLPIANANRALFNEAMQAGQAQDDAIAILKILRRGR
ncbi:3-hydroxyisobutyrate dehydrogenase [Variovorax sp. HW608]|uniref:NAD(P)-dependent oxidoreductase n=1 Tax=Variovorax sp. HW608 TaxID=1034889 RepID=UPI00081FD664|nr:NAD(P)-dependent oxidoreductase [Variovorax sp. HW608]SCK23191.1 3-hydroxyisobutyrate dehydrogenase [Variovorax sp. HW608]